MMFCQILARNLHARRLAQRCASRPPSTRADKACRSRNLPCKRPPPLRPVEVHRNVCPARLPHGQHRDRIFRDLSTPPTYLRSTPSSGQMPCQQFGARVQLLIVAPRHAHCHRVRRRSSRCGNKLRQTFPPGYRGAGTDSVEWRGTASRTDGFEIPLGCIFIGVCTSIRPRESTAYGVLVPNHAPGRVWAVSPKREKKRSTSTQLPDPERHKAGKYPRRDRANGCQYRQSPPLLRSRPRQLRSGPRMSLRLTNGDDNRRECGIGVDEARNGRGRGPSLDLWRPCRSLIRDPRCEPIECDLPLPAKGRACIT